MPSWSLRRPTLGENKRRTAAVVAGTAAVAAGSIIPGAQAKMVEPPPPATPDPVPPATARPFPVTHDRTEPVVIDAAAYDPLSIFGAEIEAPADPVHEVGAIELVMRASDDDTFGKAEVTKALLLAVDDEAMLEAWLRDAGFETDEPVDIDVDALFKLADTLESRGVRATHAGLERFAYARGLVPPVEAPTNAFVAQLLAATPQDLRLDVVALPSDAAATTIRFLRGLEDPSGFLDAWRVAVDDGVLSATQAEAIHTIATRRGIDLSAEPEAAAAALRPVGARPADEAARFEWYTNIITTLGHEARTGPNEMNVVGLRGYDLELGPHDNAFGQWNDTIAFLWRDDAGVPHVIEHRATTDPGQARGDAPDVNGDGVGDVAHLRPGQYTYFVGTHRGRPGAGNPTENVPVNRDTNHDGTIDIMEAEASRVRDDRGYGINIHWGPGNDGGQVGGYSLGCQVLTMDYRAFRSQIEPLLGFQDRVPYTLVQFSDIAFVENVSAAG